MKTNRITTNTNNTDQKNTQRDWLSLKTARDFHCYDAPSTVSANCKRKTNDLVMNDHEVNESGTDGDSTRSTRV